MCIYICKEWIPTSSRRNGAQGGVDVSSPSQEPGWTELRRREVSAEFIAVYTPCVHFVSFAHSATHTHTRTHDMSDAMFSHWSKVSGMGTLTQLLVENGGLCLAKKKNTKKKKKTAKQVAAAGGLVVLSWCVKPKVRRCADANPH